MDSFVGLAVNLGLSVAGCILSSLAIDQFIPIFLQRNQFGFDQCKSSKKPVPEPMGVVTAAVYLTVMFIFIPFPFTGWLSESQRAFPFQELVQLLSALLAICCMIFLGFVDDVLDLRWRHKLLFPFVASLPLLLVYFATHNSTTVVLPKQLAPILGTSIDIGPLYYLFIMLLAVFCTNSINILAGVNGLEAGQSLVIAVSIILYNVIQIFRGEGQLWSHMFSLYFLCPYVGTTLVLFSHNWYPAKVFVGDTFCYFSGMTLAVVGILGHFSKTLSLFFIPQILNFLYSLPQVFRLIPCPRHRLPKYREKEDKVVMSLSEFKKSDLKPLGGLVVGVLGPLGLLYVREFEKDGEVWLEVSNMTLICLLLKAVGPLHEQTLVLLLLAFQVLCSCAAFAIRFLLAGLIYDVVN